MNRRRGSVLILVTILTLMVGGLTAAILATTFTQHRAARESLNRELAYQAAESGASYYVIKLAAESGYFTTNPAPHAPMFMGSTSFQLESAQSLGANNQWEVILQGVSDTVTYRLNAVIGHRQIRIPDGIVAVGTGNPATTILRLQVGSKVGSFDPADGPYDPLDPGDDANIAAKGSLSLSGSSSIYGDVMTTGTSTTDAASTISGTDTENAADFPVADIDPLVFDAMNSSQATNDNAALRLVFGAQWRPLLGSQNYGDLIVTTPGTYVIPAGVYRLRRFEVRGGATVVFDTSLSPSKLVYVGSGSGTGSLNDLIVTGASKVKVDPKGTTNGLLTVLGPDCDFVISSNSIFGQAIGDPNNAGYTQIISLGGNTSSDDITVTTGAKVYGRLYAAAHSFTLSAASWYGSALARAVNLTNSTFAVDVGSLGAYLADPGDYDVLARWPGAP